MKKLMFVLIASACCSAFTINASAQQADQATADAVIAMTKAQWASEIKDPTAVAEQSKDTSDDYTEFNGQYATRLDGKAMTSRLSEASGKDHRDPCKNDACFCEKGRQMDVGPRKFCVRSTAKTIRL